MPSFLSSVAAQRPKERGFQQQAFGLARLQPLFTASSANFTATGALRRSVQDRLGACDELSGGNDLVDQADAIGLLRVDHLAGENQLQGAALSDQPRQALRAAVARNDAELDFRLAELRVLGREPDGAGHRQFAAAAEGEAVDGRNDRLAEVLDEVEDRLPVTVLILALRRR